MKIIKKKELRDVNKEEYKEWKKRNCGKIRCRDCMFGIVDCSALHKRCWVKNKDMYSDKFLDQEIEIEIERPKPTKEEIALLKKINPEWKWMAKGKDGEIYFYEKPIKKGNNYWCTSGGCCIFAENLFKITFDFLSWEDEEPTNIQELIKEYKYEN